MHHSQPNAKALILSMRLGSDTKRDSAIFLCETLENSCFGRLSGQSQLQSKLRHCVYSRYAS